MTEAVSALQVLRTVRTNHRLAKPRALRMGQKAWVAAAGTLEQRQTMAAFYLVGFDHKTAAIFEEPVATMAKVVCNLRYYYRLNAKQTADLMLAHFNAKSRYRWSEEGILLAWELVEGFTPSLGLSDKDAVAKHLLAELENDVIDFLAQVLPGGRVPVEDLYARFKASFPDVDTNEIAFGRVVTSLTGINSKSSKGRRYYSGFHLPSEDGQAATSRVVPIRKQQKATVKDTSDPLSAA